MNRKILIVAGIAALALAFAACTLIPTVDAANIYTENSADLVSGDYATGITINGSTYFQIDGSFASASDDDSFIVNKAAGVTHLEIYVLHNGTQVNSDLLGINYFPLHIYDGTTNIINAASNGGCDVASGATELEFSVPATASTLLGGSLPYTSGNYSIIFK